MPIGRVAFCVLAILCATQMSACVGLGFIHERERTFTYERELVLRIWNLYPERGDVGYSYGFESKYQEKHEKEDVLKMWGPPDKTEVQGSTEIWVYQREMGFSGPWLMIVVIPIPLVAPVGYRNTILHFSGDSLVKIVKEEATPSGFLCGLVLIGPGGLCTTRLGSE